MAWHVVHALLEQCRKISTFPGKIWVMVMFAFRMVMVARVGDQVYSDEQEYFYCNTMTPGCNQVCYSHFAPISHLRFWSVMVIVTATPPIVFFAYASHIITRASRKREEKEYLKIRKKDIRTKLQSEPSSKVKQTNRYIKYVRRRKVPKEKSNGILPNKQADERLISSRAEEPLFEKKPEFKSSSYPIYDKKYNVMEIHDPDDDPPMMDDPNQKEIMSKFTALHHPDIARAYWWQVLIRTLIEAAFLFGQYWMFGFEVPLKINCLQYPCPTMTECWVSRAMEKTIFLWFMFIVGAVSLALGLLEFWSLGISRLKVAFGCASQTRFQNQSKKKPDLTRIEHLGSLDMDRFSLCSFGADGSSGSTMSSV